MASRILFPGRLSDCRLQPSLHTEFAEQQLSAILTPARNPSRSSYKSLVCAHSSSSSRASPFTEYFSDQRQWGGNDPSSTAPIRMRQELVDRISDEIRRTREEPDPTCASDSSRASDPCSQSLRSSEDDDIEAHLPELRQVLEMLQRKMQGEAAQPGPGNVYLVGTGPGDPDLLTVKALKLLQRADLVLYDRLVSTDILDLIHPSARLLYVGKTAGYHSRTQEEIHELLLSFAEVGATVVRLKGGDPLVFGRGGEEMEFLQSKGIRVQIVPGITAASGIAAELGVPLTQRGVANSVRFMTGHSRKGGEDPLYVAESAADPDSTLVIYMGLATLPGLTAKLMARGLPGVTPAVAVERGTTADQRVVFAELADLVTAVQTAELASPTLIFIGQVVALSPLWPGTRSTEKVEEKVKGVEGGVGKEPRDRSLRGSDPRLPSEVVYGFQVMES